MSVADYHFIMTLADGTTRQTVIDSRVFLDDRRVDEVCTVLASRIQGQLR